jgi:hypothetical protein
VSHNHQAGLTGLTIAKCYRVGADKGRAWIGAGDLGALIVHSLRRLLGVANRAPLKSQHDAPRPKAVAHDR